jgi:hypothetical protein
LCLLLAFLPSIVFRHAYNKEGEDDSRLARLADLDPRALKVIPQSGVVFDETSKLELGHGCRRERNRANGESIHKETRLVSKGPFSAYEGGEGRKEGEHCLCGREDMSLVEENEGGCIWTEDTTRRPSVY